MKEALTNGHVDAMSVDKSILSMKKYSALDASVFNIERQKMLLELKSQDFENLITDAIKLSYIERNDDLLKKIRIEDIKYN